MPVRQINLSDEVLFERLYEANKYDPFFKPLIHAYIKGHREGNPESTKWIRECLGWGPE